MADRTLDTIGKKCPQPLFEVHKAMQEMITGDVVTVTADDPAFKLDIEAWCRRTGNSLEDLQKGDATYTARIRKTN